ncbi:DUF6265 family protein [uncultured Mucilaginibacter sp.]|uniref:DUF6265 family protein n=1 Tax=uncultured Mucilaginibacter sp. TaxID=797541 RepID=UPI0025FA2037|nr:DUF6265 family protein [uncultured Mucilaginibacter sp.]
MYKSLSALIVVLFIFGLQAFAQVKNFKINDLSFMAGTWTLKHQWGDMEEFWGPPMGNNMVSSYRCVKDGKVVFYEFVVIEQTNGDPVMKMRHFNPGSIAWEDKDKPHTYKLIVLTKSKAVFEDDKKEVKLTYERTSSTKMNCILEEKDKKGKLQKDIFAYTLKP